MRYHIGTSGWNYRHWLGPFYPEGTAPRDFFAHYAAHFDTVEVNNTFYRLPTPETVEQWAEQAPRDFQYALKASRYLSHVKRLKEAGEPLERFLHRARLLGSHLGPVLVQLPGRWRVNVERLESFCRALPAEILHVFEFRDPSWLCDEVYEILERYHASLCLHDLVAEHPHMRVGPLVYVRLHGAEASGSDGRYTPRDLRGWAKSITHAAAGAKGCYIYFNNDQHGYAVQNALWLKQHLGEPATTA